MKVVKTLDTVTVWESPASMLDTGVGRVTYYEWCTKECKRMGTDCHIITASDGEIAIARGK